MANDSTSISWESVYKISCSWVHTVIFYILLFGIVYEAKYDFAMDLRASVYQISYKSWKKRNRDPGNDHGRKHEPYKEIPNTQTKESKTGESQGHAHLFFLHQGDCS
jgi:hypothetical protein